MSEQQPSSVDTKHPQYEASTKRWARCRDVAAGADRVKGRETEYLPQPQGMTREDYSFYLQRALFYNAMARTVSALTGLVFRRDPVVANVTGYEEHLRDVSLRDEPLDAFAMKVVSETLLVGRHAILLDMPRPQPGLKPRPYWISIPAERVINWKTAHVGTDPEQLVLAVISEDQPVNEDPFGHKTQSCYRELALLPYGSGLAYHVRTWTKDERGHFVSSPWLMPTRRNVPLDFIPLTFVGPLGVSPEVDRPPLEDLAIVNVAHYRNSADHEHGLFFTALPTPWASGVGVDTVLRVGPSTCWKLDQGGQAGMLEFTGAGLAAIRDAMAAKERLMATLGARLLETYHTNEAPTATEVRMRNSGELATLQTIAGAASSAITRVLRWHMWWDSGVGDISTKPSFSLVKHVADPEISPEKVKTALMAVQSGQMSSETFYELLQIGGWTRKGVTWDQEKQAIAADTPDAPPEDKEDDKEDDDKDKPKGEPPADGDDAE